jgi:hypothetical protein
MEVKNTGLKTAVNKEDSKFTSPTNTITISEDYQTSAIPTGDPERYDSLNSYILNLFLSPSMLAIFFAVACASICLPIAICSILRRRRRMNKLNLLNSPKLEPEGGLMPTSIRNDLLNRPTLCSTVTGTGATAIATEVMTSHGTQHTIL